MPSVLLVDDDPNMCFLERMVLKSAGGRFEVIGEAPSGHDAIRCWRELNPEMIVMDDRLPDIGGLDVARLILAERPGQVIVLLTTELDPTTTATAARLGIRACLPKSDVRRLPAQLMDCSP